MSPFLRTFDGPFYGINPPGERYPAPRRPRLPWAWQKVLMSQELEAILRRSGTLTSRELTLSLDQANARNISLWDLLVLERQVPEETLAEAFSKGLKMPRVRLAAV